MLETLAPALNTEQRLILMVGLKSLYSAMSWLNLVSEFQSSLQRNFLCMFNYKKYNNFCSDNRLKVLCVWAKNVLFS